MLYQQSFGIERRLHEALDLIRTGMHSTPSLAKALRVSVPTVSRCIRALRERGHDIRPVRKAEGWHYVLMPESEPAERPAILRIVGLSQTTCPQPRPDPEKSPV